MDNTATVTTPAGTMTRLERGLQLASDRWRLVPLSHRPLVDSQFFASYNSQELSEDQ